MTMMAKNQVPIADSPECMKLRAFLSLAGSPDDLDQLEAQPYD